MKLYNHQEKAIEMIKQSIREGKKRPLLAAPTGSGKTVIAGHILKSCEEKGKRGFFFMDRTKLVDQTIDKFTTLGINFGVMQSNHPLSNPSAPIQIVSTQTIAALVKTHNQRLPEFDLMICDEAHVSYKIIRDIMVQYDNIPIIGLSASPFSKGLGKLYDNLLTPVTTRELLDQGYLCPTRYYGGEHVNLSKIRSSDPNNYNAQDLESETDKDSDRLSGCIIRNWMEFGEGSQTIAFSPSQNLSKALVERFNRNGISAYHIDCYMSQDQREELYEAHDNNEFKVLSCSKLLNVGYDAPAVRCIIDCYPVKSVTTYVQRVGRAMRTHQGKEYSIYLDHAGNFERFGYAEDIVPESLHDGEKTHREQDLVKKDKKELKTRECPECLQQMAGYECRACGYQVPQKEQIEDDGKMLQEIQNMEGKKANRTTSKEIKEQFYSELEFYANTKDYNKGWASNVYRERFGVWPNSINCHQTDKISDLTKNWLKHRAIKYNARKTG